MLYHFIRFLFLIGIIASTGFAQGRMPSAKERLHVMSDRIFGFWLDHGIDAEAGGIYGSHNDKGVPSVEAPKGLIQEARHLYALSLYYEQRHATEKVRTAARSIKDFLIAKIRDEKSGFYYLSVSADGSKIENPRHLLYAHDFVILGLAQYGKSFGDTSAIAESLRLYHLIAEKPYDPKSGGFDPIYGGFDQTGDPWFFSHPESKKDLGTHIHLLEALTTLFQVTNEPEIKSRLNALVDTFVDQMAGHRNYFPVEYRRDFIPVEEQRIKFGYNLIASWVLYDAAKTVGRHGEAKIRSTVQRIAQFNVSHSFDSSEGGFYEFGDLNGQAQKRGKVWWIQAEGMMTLAMLYELTGNEEYLRQIDQCLDWIEHHQIDQSTGEWWWEITNDHVSEAYRFIGGEWKDSYHHGRATLLLPGRLP